MIVWKRLTLGELRSAAGAFETVFLPLFDAGITGEKSSDFEGGTIFASFEKGAGDAEADRFGLAGESTADDGALDIVAVGAINGGEGLLQIEDEGREGHVFIDGLAVDDDLAFAGSEVDASDRGFAAAGAIVLFVSHGWLSPYLLRSRT